jgi:hypothetical protein
MNGLLFACIPLSVCAQAPRHLPLLNANPGFEEGLAGWAVHNPPDLVPGGVVELVDAPISGFTFGQRHVRMRLPESARDNYTQYINLGQAVKLSPKKRYQFCITLKWTNAGSPGAPRQAVVSTWVRDPAGAFSGSDVFLTGPEIHPHVFEFSPKTEGESFCYVALNTNIEGPRVTEIILDRFRIEELGDVGVEPDDRDGDLLAQKNPGFEDGLTHWTRTENNPHRAPTLACELVPGPERRGQRLRLTLPSATAEEGPDHYNETWTGVYQTVRLFGGHTYRLSALVDRLSPREDGPRTILNFYAFRPALEKTTGTAAPVWLGSIDHPFTTASPHRASQLLRVTETADYQITARLFGWAQNGQGAVVEIDDFVLERLE